MGDGTLKHEYRYCRECGMDMGRPFTRSIRCDVCFTADRYETRITGLEAERDAALRRCGELERGLREISDLLPCRTPCKPATKCGECNSVRGGECTGCIARRTMAAAGSSFSIECPDCDGSGILADRDDCFACDGSGRAPSPNTGEPTRDTVTIPVLPGDERADEIVERLIRRREEEPGDEQCVSCRLLGPKRSTCDVCGTRATPQEGGDA